MNNKNKLDAQLEEGYEIGYICGVNNCIKEIEKLIFVNNFGKIYSTVEQKLKLAILENLKMKFEYNLENRKVFKMKEEKDKNV